MKTAFPRDCGQQKLKQAGIDKVKATGVRRTQLVAWGAPLVIFYAGFACAAGPATGGWLYEKEVDKMTGNTVAFAATHAVDSLDLAAPYKGTNIPRLVVRKFKNKGPEVIFGIEKGQLMCRSYSPCRIDVRFDDGNLVTFQGEGAADQSSTMTFIQNPKKFIALASKAKRIYLRLAIYNNGNPIIEFSSPAALDVSSLK